MPSVRTRKSVRRGGRAVLVPVAAAVALSGVAVVPPAAAAPVDVALEWYDATAQTIAAAGAPTQSTNSRTWAIGWLAAARAVRATPKGVQPRPFQEAAVAGAVHASLVALVPARKDALDAALRRTLGRIPDGTAERRGLAAGRRQARVVLASREDDGLDPQSVNAPFPTPAPKPGIWQPTPPANSPALQAGNRKARPFLLARASQYRLKPPPALGSARYRADLAEVRAYGSIDSKVRTPRQTETANFWLGSSLTLYTEPLRVALARSKRPLAARTKLVALFHVALVDTQIATSDTKYAYLRWRPITAIRSADIDGDPTTTPDPNWTPQHTTPAHPDYPSGHNTYSGAAEEVLTALVGPRTAPFRLTSPTAPGVTRTYTTWKKLTQENVDARVWSGIHTRTADTAGVHLGRVVAEHTLRHADRLFR
ncbi:MAG TPA: vanadium-dependent haloperoxidase [Thermomonospora sp.]|nr:vanadium-dependent haloperoxidase [Thermomonospora sp.]